MTERVLSSAFLCFHPSLPFMESAGVSLQSADTVCQERGELVPWTF